MARLVGTVTPVRRVFGVARMLAAVCGVVALVGEVNFTIGTGPFAIANFFSYFTVQSMIVAVVVFLLGAWNSLREPEDPLWLDVIRALSTTYLIVSGVVFAVILIEGTLRGIPVWSPWSSHLLHFWIPGFALLDWLTAPGRDVPWTTLRWVMVYPALWVVYTMVRGAGVYWYPYFFLDPAIVAFPWEFLLYLGVIVGIFTGVLALLVGTARLTTFERVRERFSRPLSVRGPRTARGS